MACFETRANGNTRVKIRLTGYPSVSRSFTHEEDAREWAANTERAMKQARHYKVSMEVLDGKAKKAATRPT